ncbi:uncharacterized protein HKW66_Vig0003320 [Vigna angularis]|uniref:Uncharacterized protein n=1 Tax=Phaseolus angularis TaxID=3914 RepID=A0A8T0LCB3_PHAAN|nr:uncharacterized protein HKW66_Vig0003320 [Vigna angularis]
MELLDPSIDVVPLTLDTFAPISSPTPSPTTRLASSSLLDDAHAPLSQSNPTNIHLVTTQSKATIYKPQVLVACVPPSSETIFVKDMDDKAGWATQANPHKECGIG